MGYFTKYNVEFSDFANNDNYRVRVRLKEGTDPGIPIVYPEATSTPCQITWNAKDDKFGGVTGSEMQVSFYNDNYDLTPLFVVDPFGVELSLERQATDLSYDTVWRGFLNPETYTEDFSWTKGVVQIVANDGLAALDRIKYNDGNDDGIILAPLELGFAYVKDIILNCISELTTDSTRAIDRIMMSDDIRGDVSTILSHRIDLANFVNEDGVSETKRSVLDWICTTYALNATVFGGALWLMDSCLMAGNSNSVKGYDLTWTQQIGYNETLNPIDLSGQDVIKYDGTQTREIKSGLNRIDVNYSPYATEDKVNRCRNLDERNYTSNTSLWNGLSNDANGDVYSWVRHLTASTQALTETGVTVDATSANLHSHFSVKKEEPYNKISADNTNAYVGVYNNNALIGAVGEKVVTMKGGYLPITSDSIQIKFKAVYYAAMDDPAYNTLNLNHARVRVPVSIKIGSKYASAGGSDTYTNIDVIPPLNQPNQPFTVDGASEVVFCSDAIANNQEVNQEFEFNITIGGIVESGLIEISLYNNNRMFTLDSGGSTYRNATRASEWLFGVKDCEVTINGYSFNDDDVEEAGTTDIQFQNDISVDSNISSKRDQGSLDRGCLINSNDEHESIFYRRSFSQDTNAAGALIQGYLGNYRSKYNVLNANLSLPTTLLDAENRTHDGIISPVTVIKDSSYGLNNNMAFSNGTFDVRNSTVTGTWSELFDANVLLT